MNARPRLWLTQMLALLAVLAIAPCARADDGADPICANRPGKGAPPCTVPQGRWQVETGLADVTHDSVAGVTTDTAAYAAINLRYGVTKRLEADLTLTPFETLRLSGRAPSVNLSGFGDLVLGAKFALNNPSGPVVAALFPFVKVPTAGRRLGNGDYEGGLGAPLAFTLPAQWALNLTPQIAALSNSDRPGHHPALSAAVSVSRPLTPALTAAVELWAQSDQDPAAHVWQESLDLSLAWIPAHDPSLQWDGGLNLGLTRATPRGEAYIGLSRRF